MAAIWRPGRGRRDPGLGPSLTPLARPSVLLIVYRWRCELVSASCVVAGFSAAVSWVGLGPTLVGLAGLTAAAGLAAAWPATRRLAAARAWCVITPHRVRTCFAQAWIYNRAGQIPAVLRTVGKPYGERVLVWCRAGISFEDIQSACDLLAAACWSIDVVASRSGRFAQLVYLDVIRRPQWQSGTRADPGPADSDVPPQPWPGETLDRRRPFDAPGDDRQDAA
jgi:hypothetical protein